MACADSVPPCRRSLLPPATLTPMPLTRQSPSTWIPVTAQLSPILCSAVANAQAPLNRREFVRRRCTPEQRPLMPRPWSFPPFCFSFSSSSSENQRGVSVPSAIRTRLVFRLQRAFSTRRYLVPVVSGVYDIVVGLHPILRFGNLVGIPLFLGRFQQVRLNRTSVWCHRDVSLLFIYPPPPPLSVTRIISLA